VTGLFDHGSRCFIDLPALERFVAGIAVTDPAYPGVAGRGNDIEYFDIFLRDAISGVPRPGQVAIDAAGVVQLCPQVDEDEVIRPDDAGRTRLRLIMRVAAVRADGADRWMITRQAVFVEVFQDPLLNVRLVDRTVAPQTIGYEFECHVERRSSQRGG